ncbi:MAG: c-type cytochrome, partial [Planctomycetia bacterium]|nr:c-type cytochrome [Planctomycetia bacterium]
DDQEESVRLQAAHFLSVLNDPRSEPKVQSVRRKNEQGKLQLADLINPDKAWVAGPFPDNGKGFETVHAPERGPIDLSAQHAVGERSVTWKQMPRGPRFFNFHEAFGDVNDSSSYAFFRLESPRKQQAMLLVGSDDGIKVWHNGRVVHTNDISRAALPLQDIVYLDLEPGSNDILFRVRNLTGESGLYIHYRTLDKIPPTLPEPISAGSLTERLKNATTSGNAPVDPKFLAVNWLAEAKTGDIARGKKLFSAEGLGCAKCHAIRADQPVTGGPSLAETAKRFTIPHLVESVLAPSRMVSPVFKATLVITKDGKQSSGLVIGETGEKLELLLPDAKRVTFAKSDIEETKLQDISPMPAGLVKQPDELRDLLAFLLSEQEK